MADKETVRKLTLKDVLDEVSKPIMVPISAAGGELPYVRPTDKERKELQKDVDKWVNEQIKVVQERNKMNCFDAKGNPIPGAIPESEQSVKDAGAEKVGDLLLWKGLNKADSSVSVEMVEELPMDVKSQMNLHLAKVNFGDAMSDQEVNQIKNLLALTKDLS